MKTLEKKHCWDEKCFAGEKHFVQYNYYAHDPGYHLSDDFTV